MIEELRRKEMMKWEGKVISSFRSQKTVFNAFGSAYLYY